ncbi:protein misato homolog 1-like isoform X2 [Aquarana catesbeiana]|uniref:protein misato homolog 1-like isoform X2 n=1 Tax=Aquarana catesbeiana TaxID=8400 RepID=UPI003CC9FD78
MGAVCREVISIQLGQYANCVGAHWWNLQAQGCRRSEAELCSNVQFRAGITQNGVETYMPRLIILDIKDGGLVRTQGAGYKEEEEAAQATPAWRGKVTTHREDQCSAGPATQEGGASKGGGSREKGLAGGGANLDIREEPHQPITQDGEWSDYLCTQLHPKSLCMLSHGSGGNVGSLESFSQGESFLRGVSHQEEVEDRLRFFSEECDYLQGFHILCDTHSGFSGAGSKMAELIHDEYPGRGILSFGTSPVLSEHRAGWRYHSSAVLAAALDTLTAPYRLPSSTLTMSHLLDTLSFSGRKVLAASCSLPFPIGSSSFLPDALLPHMTSPPWRSLSACADGAPLFSQSVVLRGVPRRQQISSLPAGTRPPSSLHACASGEEVLQCYLSAVCPRTLSVSHLLGTPCMLGPTFPQFFSRYITKDGVTEEEPLTDSTVVGGVPVMAALHSSSALQLSLRSLCDEVTKMDIKRSANFSTAGIEEEELKEAIDELRSLARCYQMYEGEDSDD